MQSFSKSSRLAAMGIFAGLLSVSGSALAAPNASMAVTANVTAVCDITSTGLGFGAYNPLSGTDTDATATVSVTCTNGLLSRILLDDGLNQNTGSTAAVPLRRAISGANYLSYELYSDSGHSVVWGGDAATGVAHTGTGAEVDLTVYGRMPAAQNVPGGSYADTIAVLVTF